MTLDDLEQLLCKCSSDHVAAHDAGFYVNIIITGKIVRSEVTELVIGVHRTFHRMLGKWAKPCWGFLLDEISRNESNCNKY